MASPFIEPNDRGDPLLRGTKHPAPQRRIAVRKGGLRIDPDLSHLNVSRLWAIKEQGK